MHCTEKYNLQHLCIPNQKLIHLLVNITRCHLHHGKRQFATFVSIPTRNWHIYWDENVFLLCTTGIFRVQRNPHYYAEIFYQFLHTNQYFLNATLILSHTLHTHITEGSIFISELCLSNLEFGCLNNLKYLIEWSKLASEKKGQDENSHNQLEWKHVPFSSINIFVISILDPM